MDEATVTETGNAAIGGTSVRNPETCSNIFDRSSSNAIMDHSSFALTTASVNNSTFTDLWLPNNSRNVRNSQQHISNANADENNLTSGKYIYSKLLINMANYRFDFTLDMNICRVN